MTGFFDNPEYVNFEFILQLPYKNKVGSAITVDITPHSAADLHRRGVCKVLKITDGLFLMVPVIPAEQNMVFQVGEDPV